MTPENYMFNMERLKSIQREETEISNKSCRYAVNTIIATVLGLLIKDNIQTNDLFNISIFKTLLLFVVLLIAIVLKVGNAIHMLTKQEYYIMISFMVGLQMIL